MAYATLQEYETRYGPVPEAEQAAVTAWLEDVSAVITARLAPCEPDPGVARMITLAVVNRIISGGNVRSSQAGGVSVTYAVAGRWITDEEWTMLSSSPLAPSAYTIPLRDQAFECLPYSQPRW
jgi:hypothetical protein